MSWTSVARAQAGLIRRGQLTSQGVPMGTVDRWLAVGRLEATRAEGVYRVAGSADNEWTPAWYAALSTSSSVSYLTAASWWGMSAPADRWLHITRFDRKRLDWPSGVRVHRVALSPSDVTEYRGLLVTSRKVTVLDCAGWLPFATAVPFVDRAIQQGWVRTDDIRNRLDDAPGRWGNRQLRRMLATLERGAEAESECRLHRLLRDAGITGWVTQLAVATAAGTVRIDVAFPALRLAVEVDGFAYHSAGDRFQRDRTKQNALQAIGWRVLRFTWTDVVNRPHDVIDQITSLLAA